MLGVFTMQAIYADLTALHYDRFMESVIIPLFCVTLATLGIVVFINRRRIRELKASGQKTRNSLGAYRTAIVVPLDFWFRSLSCWPSGPTDRPPSVT